MILRTTAAANFLRVAAIIGAILLTSACSPKLEDAASKTGQAHRLIAKQFQDLPGWAQDHHGNALNAFLKSCPALVLRNAPIPNLSWMHLWIGDLSVLKRPK